MDRVSPDAGERPKTPSWVWAANLEELPPNSACAFDHGGRAFAVFHLADGSFACLSGLCPHQEAPLANGLVNGPVLTCPRMGCLRWQFDVATGQCLQHSRIRCRTYPIRVEAGSLWVDVA